MLEDLPPDFVPRPAEFEALIARLLGSERGGTVAITAALRDAGSYGKTTLARALCHNQRVREAFPDGVLWVTLSEHPGDLTGRVEDLIEMLTRQRPGFVGVEAAAIQLAEVVAERRLVLVIDDVWNAAHLKPFLQGGPHCARLITTRGSGTLPPGAQSQSIAVDAMRHDEAVALLGTGLPPGQEGMLQRLAARLGKWPMLLKLANGVLLEQIGLGLSFENALAYVSEALDELGLIAFDAQNTAERAQAVAATLGVSLKLLDAEERARYDELAIFPEDVKIPLATLAKLWGTIGGLKPFHVKQLCLRLFRLSLVQSYDVQAQRIQLHDVVRAYLPHELGTRLPAVHSQLLDAHWTSPPAPLPVAGKGSDWANMSADEPYLWHYLAYHLAAAGRTEELRPLLLDFDWLWAKLSATDINRLLADYDVALSTTDTASSPLLQLRQEGGLGGQDDLSLIQGALRLSAHVLARDKMQLAGQLLGRLLGRDEVAIRGLLDQARQWRGGEPWLRPLTATLTLPGGPLLHILPGHAPSPVYSVAATADGRQAISASSDGTLKVWDLEHGVEVAALRTDAQYALLSVAVARDGGRAVAGSTRNTVEVWDLQTKTHLRTLRGHTKDVNGVAVTSDGRRAISASHDQTLKVWDLEHGAELYTLRGHTSRITGVAVTPDGRYAISASWDETLKVWDIASGLERRTLARPADDGRSIATVADGRQVISAASGGTLKLWNWEAEGGPAPPRGHTRYITTVAISPDGQRALSAAYSLMPSWRIVRWIRPSTMGGRFNG
jgi:hypothetical protein